MKIIAHRGYSSNAPENTLVAFQQAIDFGADGLECDVHLTKDGEVVVIHDEILGRTTNGSGFIKDKSLEEMGKLDAGSWFGSQYGGEKVPTLRELLELVKDTDLLLNVEIKSARIAYPGIEQKVVQELQEFGLIEQSIISSFNHQTLAVIKQIEPALKTGILHTSVLYKPLEYASMLNIDAFHGYHHHFSPELIKEAQAKGLYVNLWTVDEPADIKRLIELGVDGIITNYPDRVQEQLKS